MLSTQALKTFPTGTTHLEKESKGGLCQCKGGLLGTEYVDQPLMQMEGGTSKTASEMRSAL